MSFIEEYNVIVNENNTLYRRLENKKMLYNRITSRELNEGTILSFPSSKFYFSQKSETSLISPSIKFKRAGVIPYTQIDDKKYFCMGIDYKYGTLTDFGGGVKRIENFVEAACRELEEESLGIFDFTTPEKMDKVRKNSITVYDSSTAIIFLQVKVDSIDEIVKIFQQRYLTAENPENCNIIWIPEDIFFHLIKSGRTIRNGKNFYPSVYKVVNDLLRSVSNINEIF